MGRTSAHVIETQSKNQVRKAIDEFYANGDALFRELTERDYGIDGIIELFEHGLPTGMIALVQIKGTEKTISPLKNNRFVSCPISTSNAQYAMQTHIPVILIYICVSKPVYFYYARIQDALDDKKKKKVRRQKIITVQIPVNNTTAENMEPLFELIREYYKR